MTLLTLLATPAALGCAGLMTETDELAESGSAEMIFEQTAEGASVEYLVVYEGEARSLGWVVPIPARFVSIGDGDVSRFEALRTATSPLVSYTTGSGGGGCCAKSGGDNLRGDTAGLDVVVEAEGYTGTYDYTVVSATSTEGLRQWLFDNGWESSFDLSAPALNAYVSEGGFQFVLLSVSPEDAFTPEGGRDLPPVRITWEGSELRYPALMARYSRADKQRTTVWVVGSDRASVSGWKSGEVNSIAPEEGQEPLDAFLARLRYEGGSAPGYGLTFSGAWDGGWVTRFDGLVDREAHTVDPVFALGDGTDEVRAVITVYGEAGTEAYLFPFVLLGLGSLIGRRRKRT